MRELDIDQFNELIEESQDLQVDAMRGAKDGLDDLVEAGLDRRNSAEYKEQVREEQAHSLRKPLIAAGVAAGAVGLVAASSGTAFAASADVMALQTAASIENLAVLTYTTALTLPYLKTDSTAIKTVVAFAKMTSSQHADHAKAFNAAAVRLGGKAQTATDPKYTPVVTAAVPKLKKGGPLDVIALAITLEDVAASTYTKNVTQISDKTTRELFGTVASVENQHIAILYAVQALLKGGGASLIAIPTDDAKLPAAAGSVGFPVSFKATTLASPITEGVVK